VTIWLDAHLSPKLIPWLASEFHLEAKSLRELGLRDAEDEQVFAAARQAGATVMTKDSDFVTLLARHGPPPRIIWLTCGNTSNRQLRGILGPHLAAAIQLIEAGEPLVEISGRPSVRE
jgi:predicted nuclease of predicted toxin-antitoxin system